MAGPVIELSRKARVGRMMRVVFVLLVASKAASAGSVDGKTYTNFGWDLATPIFPVNGTLDVYRNKGDAAPFATLKDVPAIDQSGPRGGCTKRGTDGWANCRVKGVTGWIRHRDFLTADEYQPVASWPFRYWLFIASSGTGSEETIMLERAVAHSPYLVAPAAYSNIFFHVLFDREGRAIGPKTRRPTGDRVFLVGDAVFLAPAAPKRRRNATWLFLNFYNRELDAMCPGRTRDSCMSAVNTSPDWPGIKRMYEQPPERFRRRHDDEGWYGDGEVAFARHADPVRPLMYRIPDDVPMAIDTNPITQAAIARNRKRPVCIADCGSTTHRE